MFIQGDYSQASPPLTMLLECEARASGTTRFKVNNILKIYVYQFCINLIVTLCTYNLRWYQGKREEFLFV